MTLYEDSDFPVSVDLEAVHAEQLTQLGAPGTWGTGRQRLAVAAETRRAGIDAGLLEAPGDDDLPETALPEVALRVVRRVAVAPAEVDQEFYNDAVADGLSDAEYVEMVTLVSRVVSLDIFARGIGVDLRPLPAAQPGQPTRERPAEAVPELAWVPTIPNGLAGGATGQALFGGKPKPYIMRGPSLVPEETRAHMALEAVQYMPLDRVLQFDYQHHEGLTRPQAEIVAGRVSAINECFY